MVGVSCIPLGSLKLLTRPERWQLRQRPCKRLRFGTAFGAPVGLFCYYMSLNHTDCAAMWLEKAIGQRDTRTPWIVPHLLGSLFTSSPKWQELAKMMNLSSGGSIVLSLKLVAVLVRISALLTRPQHRRRAGETKPRSAV